MRKAFDRIVGFLKRGVLASFTLVAPSPFS